MISSGKHNEQAFSLVIFGITSNLAQIKLLPALFDLMVEGFIPKNAKIIGNSRSLNSDEEMRAYVKKMIEEHALHNHPNQLSVLDEYLQNFTYVKGDINDPNLFVRIKNKLDTIEQHDKECGNRLFHLAIHPDLYKPTLLHMNEVGLCGEECGWTRILIEKPIGRDLDSAIELNEIISEYFVEDQIYRLDHYMGKETLQNILTFRFSNDITNMLMNADSVDHIQITSAEDVDLTGRGAFYDTVGEFRDMGQNHVLQMLAFAAMERPAEYTNEAITQRRIEFLSSLQTTEDIAFGQYEGYLKHKNVAPSSTTDTFFATKLVIGSGSLNGVPVYIRGGKKLKQKVTEISVVFKPDANRLFSTQKHGAEPNVLIYRVHPNPGIVMKVLTKKSGIGHELEPTYMQYCYKTYSNYLPDPYARLIYNAFQGDQTFFVDAPEVEEQWRIIDPLVENKMKPHVYTGGSWGPKEANQIIEKDGRHWLEPSLAFCSL